MYISVIKTMRSLLSLIFIALVLLTSYILANEAISYSNIWAVQLTRFVSDKEVDEIAASKGFSNRGKVNSSSLFFCLLISVDMFTSHVCKGWWSITSSAA